MNDWPVNDWIVPDWPAPPSVRALCTTRSGGVGKGPWRSLNLGVNSGDDPADVQLNREILASQLPAPAHFLQQVHGTVVTEHPGARFPAVATEADAQWTTDKGSVCAVLAADCLPVLFCNRQGTQVAAAHAGWRGLAAGVLESTVAAMHSAPGELLAWLGPAIGPAVYQVGSEVKAAFAAEEAEGARAFVAQAESRAETLGEFRGERWLFDLYAMARHRLQRAGVGHISGGGFCTFSDPQRFFSYRRDGVTGRMASVVWLQ
jgi:YfiH family protein